MKRFIITVIIAILGVCQSMNAKPNNTSQAVDMVSYEQRWLDNKGTIALKNNTSEDIHNVSFMLEYFDMQGNAMDYETFTYDIDIAPGMTKKLDIPAYEHDRYYHYYKTKDDTGHPAFKIRYELQDYNVPDDADTSQASLSDDASRTKNHSSGAWALFTIPVMLFVIGIFVGMYVLVVVMAQRRNRNPVIWLLLSFIASPLLICIILLIIGKDYNGRLY